MEFLGLHINCRDSRVKGKIKTFNSTIRKSRHVGDVSIQLKKLQKDVLELEPQKTLTTQFELFPERDPECKYKSCTIPSCLGYKRLK
jgi:hypothetical protein